jgi:hypothetical protein
MREVVWSPTWDGVRQGWGVELLRFTNERAASSAILFDVEGVPFEMSYEIEWDARWHVRLVLISTRIQGEVRTLRLRSDGEGGWQDTDGAEFKALAGCLDVDIWPTPFTNTLPIRRLDLRVHESSEIKVGYIEAPGLTASAVGQTYTRLAKDRFLFEAEEGNFRVELPVDGDGVVLDYPGLFQRLI